MAINVNPVAVFMTIPSSSTHDMRFARLPLVVIALSEAHPAFGPERPSRPACTAGRDGRFSARARRPTAPGSQRETPSEPVPYWLGLGAVHEVFGLTPK